MLKKDENRTVEVHRKGAEGDDPLGGQERIQLPHVIQALGGQCEEHEDEDVGTHRDVRHQVVKVKSHRGEVKGEGIRDVHATGEDLQVPRSHHAHVPAGHFREEQRGRVEGHLAALLPLLFAARNPAKTSENE